MSGTLVQTAKLKSIGSGKYSSIDQLLDAFHQAAATAQLGTYFGCFDVQGRFLGTDASENWTVAEFYDFAQPHFLSGNGWVFKPIANSRKLTYFPNADTPAFCTFDELLDSESFLATSRGSGTLVFYPETGNWLIAAYHLSFPIPNDMAKDMTKSISIFEQKQKANFADDAMEKLISEWGEDEKESSGGAKTGNKSGGGSKKKGGKKK